jgi:hypothetical protein
VVDEPMQLAFVDQGYTGAKPAADAAQQTGLPKPSAVRGANLSIPSSGVATALRPQKPLFLLTPLTPLIKTISSSLFLTPSEGSLLLGNSLKKLRVIQAFEQVHYELQSPRPVRSCRLRPFQCC